MSVSKFEEYKEFLNDAKTKYTEANAELKLIKESAKEEFGTDSVLELKKLADKKEKERKSILELIEQVEEELEQLISEMEESHA